MKTERSYGGTLEKDALRSLIPDPYFTARYRLTRTRSGVALPSANEPVTTRLRLRASACELVQQPVRAAATSVQAEACDD